MADATTEHAWMVAQAAPCGRADLGQAPSLACGRHVHTAWPEPSPDAPRRDINHLASKNAIEHRPGIALPAHSMEPKLRVDPVGVHVLFLDAVGQRAMAFLSSGRYECVHQGFAEARSPRRWFHRERDLWSVFVHEAVAPIVVREQAVPGRPRPAT
jgi:hypothetical protein